MTNSSESNARDVAPRSDLEEGLSQFLAALQSDNPHIRAEALRLFRSGLLPENQDRLVDMLVAALDSSVEVKRQAAAATLTEIGPPSMLSLSMRYRKSRQPARRQEVVEILGAICLAYSMPACYVLGQALQDRDPAVRRAAEEAWQALRRKHPDLLAGAVDHASGPNPSKRVRTGSRRPRLQPASGPA